MAGLVVKSAVKKFNSVLGRRTSAEALEYLDKVVEEICRRSCDNADVDKVGTVKARHVKKCISTLIMPIFERDSKK